MLITLSSLLIESSLIAFLAAMASILPINLNPIPVQSSWPQLTLFQTTFPLMPTVSNYGYISTFKYKYVYFEYE